MASSHPLRLITGAPGSGKSLAVESMLTLDSRYLVFDMDWLIGPVSGMAGADLRSAEDLWPRYNDLWLEVLHVIELNGGRPVLFTPMSPSDLQSAIPTWCSQVHWLRLDCDESIRIERLKARGESYDSIRTAVEDARKLRRQVERPALDTSNIHPGIVGQRILEWLTALGA